MRITVATEILSLVIFAALCVVGIIILAATGTHDGSNAGISILRDLAFVAIGAVAHAVGRASR